jgi:CRP/FNR family cyclic AMP-dependent transcriptional regulator
METGAPGRVYQSGEIIVRQGDEGYCMYVIQEGQIALLREQDGQEVPLMVLGAGEFFGEMALFERQPRSATVRVLSQANVLTVDKTNLLCRITEDPSLAFHLLQHMSAHIRVLTEQIGWLTEDAASRHVPSTIRPGLDGHGQAGLEAQLDQAGLVRRRDL